MPTFFISLIKTTHYICAVIYQPTFLFISGGEIAFILFIAIMVFGADKLPEIARGLGKGMRTLKDATNDIKHEITKSAENHGIDTSITKDVKKELDKVKDDIDDFTGSVKRKF
ncbi:Sec-independent protein translocase subunit TatA/TatB [Seonamhaeicola maritimus]|uniref:Sec-independent protein translocase subunit TatA/TatB n=1 Tax=Seonamhaeicola maritimus TaxID=2591822 RepID=UPI002493E1E3|nr:twin-arginine translocase TatA/TatE family subunit [Seonamhaeicola maritimus]